MKTRLFLAALAGVALASCVTDKEYDVSAQNENVKMRERSEVTSKNKVVLYIHIPRRSNLGFMQYSTLAVLLVGKQKMLKYSKA